LEDAVAAVVWVWASAVRLGGPGRDIEYRYKGLRKKCQRLVPVVGVMSYMVL